MPVEPLSDCCLGCRAAGGGWVSLMVCLTCGWVACSDDSPGAHALAHYEETDHPLAGYPDLVIHQVEASVPEQYRLLVDGRLDVGVGRSVLAPPQVASQLFRLDVLGVLMPAGHRLGALEAH